jgi:hypothetical protein
MLHLGSPRSEACASCAFKGRLLPLLPSTPHSLHSSEPGITLLTAIDFAIPLLFGSLVSGSVMTFRHAHDDLRMEPREREAKGRGATTPLSIHIARLDSTQLICMQCCFQKTCLTTSASVSTCVDFFWLIA